MDPMGSQGSLEVQEGSLRRIQPYTAEHHSRNAGGLEKLGKARTWILPWSRQREHGPGDTLISAQ